MFLVRNQLLILFRTPYLWWISAFSPLSIFSHCLWPSTVWLWYIWGGSLEFILLGVCWASWMCRLLFFIKFGELLAITCSKNLSVSFFLLFRIHILCMLVYCTGLWGSVHFFFNLSYFCSSHWIILFDLLQILILLSSQEPLLSPPVKFSFQLYNFQFQNFYWFFLLFLYIY